MVVTGCIWLLMVVYSAGELLPVLDCSCWFLPDLLILFSFLA